MDNTRWERRRVGERPSKPQVVYEDFQPIADWSNDSNSHVLLVDLPGFKKEEVKLEVDNNKGTVTVSGETQLSENRFKRFKQDYSLPIDSDTDKISGKFESGLLFVIIPKKEYEMIEEPPKEQHYIADRIAEEQKQETSKAEEKQKKEELKQETTTTVEEKPKKDGKENDDKHDRSNGIHEERRREESKKNEGKGGLNENRGENDEKGFNFGFAESAIEMISRNKGIVLAAVLGLTVGIYLSHKLRSSHL